MVGEGQGTNDWTGIGQDLSWMENWLANKISDRGGDKQAIVKCFKHCPVHCCNCRLDIKKKINSLFDIS